MKVELEQPGDSPDFGDSLTLKISAFCPAEIFELGAKFAELAEDNIDCVTGPTSNCFEGHGHFIRFPLFQALER